MNVILEQLLFYGDYDNFLSSDQCRVYGTTFLQSGLLRLLISISPSKEDFYVSTMYTSCKLTAHSAL